MKQRLKCFFGFHDWRLFGFFPDPAWRIVWRCHRCAVEQLTPNTRAKRKKVDRVLPALKDDCPATGTTVRLVP